MGPLGFAVLRNNLSLLEGLEFTPAASATTKKDICVSGTYTKKIFFIFRFRLMGYTDVCFFSLSGVLFPREWTIPQLNEKCKVLLVGPARCFFFFFQLPCERYMAMDVVVQNPQKSSGYDQGTTMRKNT